MFQGKADEISPLEFFVAVFLFVCFDFFPEVFTFFSVRLTWFLLICVNSHFLLLKPLFKFNPHFAVLVAEPRMG